MRELAQVIPDVELLLTMEPEELAAKLLFVLRSRIERERRSVHLGNCLGEIDLRDNSGMTPYPTERAQDIRIAFTEAWSWLEAQGMLIPAPDGNGQNGWRILSRRATRFADETEFAKYEVSRLLPKDALHPRIEERVWSAFIRGEFDAAVFQAMKGVEVYVREVGGFGDELIGVKLMQEAFKTEDGTLTDMNAEKGERVARMQLFIGAIGSYKNPNSHRDVDMGDPMEALEIILLANHLMKIVDARAAEIAPG